MANSLITPSIIAKESLFHLENNMILGDKVHRQYKNEFVKIGDTVTIRRPVKFVVSDGATRVNQDVTETTTTIVINKRKHVSWLFSAQDLTLTIDEYAERYIKPAMIVLANNIDEALAQEGAEAFYNLVGTPGTTPADFQALADVAQRMDELSVPDDGNRCLVLNPAGRWGLANGLGGTGSAGVFNAEIVGGMVRKGFLGEIAGFMIYGDQNILAQQAGVQGGTTVTMGVPTNGSALITVDGGTASVTDYWRKGDVVTFVGVNSVNPVSFIDTGNLAEFVVTANTDTVAAGAASLPIFPAFNDGTGSASQNPAYQNITALPADGVTVAVLTGATSAIHAQNLGFHKNALALVTIPLELPDSAVFKARADWRGYSIRVIKDYDIAEDEEIIRLDVLYGVKAIYPDLGVRLTG